MNFSNRQADPRRHVIGFAVVVLFHVAVVYALVTGLAKKVVDVVRAPIETKVIEEIKKPPPPPPEIVVPPPPKLEAPPPPYIPPPEVQIAVPPPVAPTVALAPSPTPPPEPAVIAPVPPLVQMPVAVAPLPPAPPAPSPPPKPAAQTVGSLCTKIPKPEAPGTDASVKADIAVSLTIQGGKVTKMTVIKETYNPGSIDRKLKRAFVNSIQAAVDQYECVGDHADIPASFGFTIN
jgi:periplasmic protein TonB